MDTLCAVEHVKLVRELSCAFYEIENMIHIDSQVYRKAAVSTEHGPRSKRSIP